MIEIYLLEQLRAFAACGTLSEAAAQLHMTQPTLTRSMHKLEDYFGFPLFERAKKKLVLNDAGKLLADYAEKILNEEAEMEARVRNLDRLRRSLPIGSIAPGPLYTLLPECTARFPDLTISSTVEPEEALLRGLEAGEYRVVILTHPLEREGFLSRRYISEHLNLSIPVMHPAARKKSVTFAEMNGQNFLMFSQVGIWEDIVRAQMPASRFFKQESVEALVELNRVSELPAFTTDITVPRSGGNDSKRVNIPFSDDCATIFFYLICKEENKRWLEPQGRFDGPAYTKEFDCAGKRPV